MRRCCVLIGQIRDPEPKFRARPAAFFLNSMPPPAMRVHISENIRRSQMDTLRLWLVVGFFAGTMIYTVLVMIFQPV